MPNTNSENLTSCSFCNYCSFCNSCNYCSSCSSCYYSDQLRMSERMLFCVGEGKYTRKGAGYQKNNQIFNVQVDEEDWDTAIKSLPKIELNLKQNNYEDAWAAWWKSAEQSDKNKILELPHFNKDIFKGITGIDVETTKCHPDTITVDGVEYVKK